MALENTPPELAGDIIDRGIVLTGGGSLLKGMDTRFREETNLPIITVDDPLTSVVLGVGRFSTSWTSCARYQLCRSAVPLDDLHPECGWLYRALHTAPGVSPSSCSPACLSPFFCFQPKPAVVAVRRWARWGRFSACRSPRFPVDHGISETWNGYVALQTVHEENRQLRRDIELLKGRTINCESPSWRRSGMSRC